MCSYHTSLGIKGEEAYRTPQVKPKAMSSEAPNMKAKLIEGLSVPLENDKAMRMMRLMGWKGGALGMRGDGLMEPLQPKLDLQKRVGLGHKKIKVTRKSQKKLKNEKIKTNKRNSPKTKKKDNVTKVKKVAKSKTKSNDINKVKRQQNFKGLKTITVKDLRADEDMTMKYADSDVDNLLDCGGEPKAREATFRIQFLMEVLELIQKDKPYTLIRFVTKLSEEHRVYIKAMIDCFNDRERLESDSDRENILYNTILEEMMIHCDMWMTIQLYMNDPKELLVIKTDKTEKLDYLLSDIPKNTDSVATHCVLDSCQYKFIPISKKKFVADKIVAARLLFFFVYSRETEMVCRFSSKQSDKVRSFIERVASLLNRQKELGLGLGCEEHALFRRALGRMDSMCVNVRYDLKKYHHIRLTKVYFNMRCSICQPQICNNENISEQLSDGNTMFDDDIKSNTDNFKESKKVAKDFNNLNIETKNSKDEIKENTISEMCKDITDIDDNFKETDMQLDKNEDSVDSESCGSYYDNAEYLADSLATDFDFDAAIKLEWGSLERPENNYKVVRDTTGDLKAQYVLNNSVETNHTSNVVCDESLEASPKDSIVDRLITNEKLYEIEKVQESKVYTEIQREDVICKTNRFMEVFEKMRDKVQNNKYCEGDITLHDDQDVFYKTPKSNVEEIIESHQESKELESRDVFQNSGTQVHNENNLGDGALLDLPEIIDRCAQKIFDYFLCASIDIIYNIHGILNGTDSKTLYTNENINETDKYDNKDEYLNLNNKKVHNNSENNQEMDIVYEGKNFCKVEASTSVHYNIGNNSFQNIVEYDSYDSVKLNNNKDVIENCEDKDSSHKNESFVDIPLLVKTEEMINNIEEPNEMDVCYDIELDMKKTVEATPG